MKQSTSGKRILNRLPHHVECNRVKAKTGAHVVQAGFSVNSGNNGSSCFDNGPVMDDGYKDDALEKLGVHRAAGPFTGGKYSIYEGGTRTPFITRWKGRIQPGVSDEVVCTIDLSASLAALTGTSIPDSAHTDSMNVLDALLGEPDAKGRDHLIQQDNGSNGTLGLRVGNWKLHHYAKRKSARNVVVERKLANTPVPEFQLFDLSSDPAETKNVIDDHPEVATKLKQRLAELVEAGRSRPK